MKIRLLTKAGTIAGTALALLVPATARPSVPSGAPVNKTDNVVEVANFSYENGTDLDFSGKYAYAGIQGDQGGIGVYNVFGKKPKRVALIPCAGSQNDVAMVKPGLLALGYHSGRCGTAPGAGVRLIDVRTRGGRAT